MRWTSSPPPPPPLSVLRGQFVALARMDVGHHDATVTSTTVLVHVDGRAGRRWVREDHFYAHSHAARAAAPPGEGDAAGGLIADVMLAVAHDGRGAATGGEETAPTASSVKLAHTLVYDYTGGTAKLLLARTGTQGGAAAPATCLTQPLVALWPFEGQGGVLHAWTRAPDTWDALLGVDASAATQVRLRGVPAVWLQPPAAPAGSSAGVVDDGTVAADVLLHCDGECGPGGDSWRPLMVVSDVYRTNYTVIDWAPGCDAVGDAERRFAEAWHTHAVEVGAEAQERGAVLMEVRQGGRGGAGARLFDVHGWSGAGECGGRPAA
jgi:hypothetical protein